MPKKEIVVPNLITCVNLTTKVILKVTVKDAVLDAEGKVIKVAVREDDKPWGLYRGIHAWIAAREDWQKPFTKAHQLSAFLLRLDGLEPGAKIEISFELWTMLRDTIQGDDFELAYPYNLQLPPLFAAILNAQDVVAELKDVSTA
ncbi:hypothetical protein LCGC14_3151410 [marine sediment metagenome]|uniref:Uncharacterized protein n=1 Tax=marine sediment metagenome TaxID=412755 RepID=A0A0F8VTW0_9ZZZZ